MRSEISTYTLINEPIEKALNDILEAGWKRIEVMGEGHGFEMLTWDDGRLDRLKEKLDRHGVSVNFHMPIVAFNPASEDEEIRRETMDTWKKCIKLARYFSSDYVLCHPGRSGDKEKGIRLIQQFFRDRINDLPGHTELILENVPPYENEIGINSKELLEIGSELPKERWGICFDTGHAYLTDREEFLSEFEKLLPYTKVFHFNDNHGNRDEHLAIGNGTIPFGSIIPVLKEGKSSCFINYEMNSIEDANESRGKVESWISLE